MKLWQTLLSVFKTGRFSPSWRRSRLGWLAIALVVCGSILFSGLSAFTQEKVSVSFLVRSLEVDQLEALEQEFESQNPDIDLELIRGPNAADAVENLYTTSFLLGDSPYDIVYSDVVWIPKFAAAGWLRDLSDRVSEADLDVFLKADVEAGRYQGGFYRMPFRSDMGMLYYRTDLLEQAGLEPPNTFEELQETAKTLQEQGQVPWGFSWQGKQYEGLATVFVEAIAGYGGFWVNPETLEVGLDSPAGYQAVEFLRDLIAQNITPPGVTNYIEEDALRLFENGNAVFMRNWPYAWAQVNRAEATVQGKVGLKPMVHAPNENSAACLGGWGFAISATTPHPEEAWRVVEFLTSRESQKKFTLEFSYVPSRRDLFTDAEVLAKYSHYQALLQVADSTVPRPPVGQYAQVSDILQRYLSAALTNQISPEDAMNAAAGETRRVLGRSVAEPS
ncbi:MAG: ABC transporter substrate-binding protein [Leptolyngbyaceae cyanobacterium SM1_1_3]|nr:ABC transporter substrate-binding protein [Leptolyngbyaceae cyanobacterium SM1_1_3]NJN01118.1 ABC transporter substrate-binding protein [Leptolyngbyaceae cyanobacterium RM1_1_2]